MMSSAPPLRHSPARPENVASRAKCRTSARPSTAATIGTPAPSTVRADHGHGTR